MLLRVEEITKHFGGIAALNGVSFEVSVGEIVGVIGPNGSGKTTLFNVVAGTYLPTRGRVWLDSRDITHAPAGVRARLGIARTYQIPRPFHGLTPLENVLVPLAIGRGLPFDPTTQAKATGLLARVGLESKADAPIHQLSLMELKRLELARALALNPRFLLLDETFSGLNPAEVSAAVELISAVASQSQLGIVIVEHNMRVIMSLCSRVVVLSFGQKIAEGSPSEVAANPEVIRVYLGERRA